MTKLYKTQSYALVFFPPCFQKPVLQVVFAGLYQTWYNLSSESYRKKTFNY